MKPSINRRDLFKIVGLTAAASGAATSLTACAPADGGGSGGGQSTFHGAWPFKAPPEGHLNIGGMPYAGVPDVLLYNGVYGDLINPPMAYWLWAEKKYEYFLAESSNLDAAASTFTVKIKKGLKWSDGKDITVEDYLTTFYIQYLRGSTLWRFVTGVQAPDDSTVVFSFKEPPSVIDRYILKSKVISTATFGEWAAKAKALIDAGKSIKDPEGQALNTEFAAFRPEAIVASGPYNIDPASASNTQVTLVKNPSGYAADKVKFDQILVYNGETTEVTALVQSKDIDYATHGFAPASVSAFESAGLRILKPPVYSGPALLMNIGQLTEFADPRVRRALAHAIDRKTLAAVSMGESGKGVEFMAGFSDVQVPDWMPEADQAKLVRYELDLDKAAKLLEEAGWKRSGNAWSLPSGKPAEYEVQFPQTFADWSAAGGQVAEQLTAFGIKVAGRGLDDKQAPVDVDNSNFQLAIRAWGASAHPHPHFAFIQDLFTHNIPATQATGTKGYGFDLKVQTAAGALDLEELVVKSGQGLDLAAQKANVTKVALAYNELLPTIPLFERYGNNPALEGTRVKSFLADDDPLIQNAPYADNFVIIQLLRGEIEPVGS